MLIGCSPTATGDSPFFFFTLKPQQQHSSSPTTPFSPAMALSSLLKPNRSKFPSYPLRPPPSPPLPRLFCTATPQYDQSTPVHQQQQPSSSFSSYFSDVKSKLKQQQQQKQQPQLGTARHGPFLNPTSPAAKVSSLEEIRKNLSEFRRQAAIPDPTRSGGLPSPSFEELYKKNVATREAGSGTGTTEGIPTNSSPIYGSSLNVNKPLGESLVKVQTEEEEKRKRPMQILNVLTHVGQTPNFMLQLPKEHLVEKYFHPDNMSASEKLKIELAKVRDEFKLSESDCGSACVQVAQLTTKIKHLSSVLHKKDKHSLKGLQAMVQQRKKLLKYLRRTDWDSYCFVLSKLGLRDNPNYKIRSH